MDLSTKSIYSRLKNLIIYPLHMGLRIINCYRRYDFFYTLLQLKNLILNQSYEKNYQYYKNVNPKKYPKELKNWYKIRTNNKLKLKKPQTFNEKIQWLKLYDSTPLKTNLTDKYLVRDYVKERVGEKYLVPLLGVWNNFDDINFNNLPNKFVLKANHGCGWNIVVKDKNQFNKNCAKIKFDRWMNTNYAYVSGFELQYKDIMPKIIAEEFIQNEGNDLYDYKVWCFSGKPEYIMFLAERSLGLKMAFFDTSWNRMPFTYTYPPLEKDVPKPDNLHELLELSRALSKGFSHVRVDFYRLDDGTFLFGEMTFTSLSGICNWNPAEYDILLGEKIKLPSEKMK